MSNQQVYVDTVKQAALSMGKRLVFDFVVSKVPFLGGFILGPIVGWAIGKVLHIALMKTEMGLFFLYIDMRTSAQGRAFEKAAFANVEAQKSTDPKVRQDSEKLLIDSFRAFIKFTN